MRNIVAYTFVGVQIIFFLLMFFCYCISMEVIDLIVLMHSYISIFLAIVLIIILIMERIKEKRKEDKNDISNY